MAVLHLAYWAGEGAAKVYTCYHLPGFRTCAYLLLHKCQHGMHGDVMGGDNGKTTLLLDRDNYVFRMGVQRSS